MASGAVNGQHAATIAAERPRLVRGWRIPQHWRERTDWVSTDTTLGQLLRGARWLGVGVFLLGQVGYGFQMRRKAQYVFR